MILHLRRLHTKFAGKRILSVICYLPSRHGNEDVSSDRYYKKFYGKQPNIRELIDEAVKAAPGRTMIAGKHSCSTFTVGF